MEGAETIVQDKVRSMVGRFRTRKSVDATSSVSHDILHATPFFEKSDRRFLDQLVQYLEVEMFAPGDQILTAGDVGEKMYFLHRGEVEVVVGPDLKRVATLQSGTIFGEMALFGCGKRTATIRAMEFCDCRVIHQHNFHSILDSHPKERKSFEKIAAERKAKLAEVKQEVKQEAIDRAEPTDETSRRPSKASTDGRRPSKTSTEGRFHSNGSTCSVASGSQSLCRGVQRSVQKCAEEHERISEGNEFVVYDMTSRKEQIKMIVPVHLDDASLEYDDDLLCNRYAPAPPSSRHGRRSSSEVMPTLESGTASGSNHTPVPTPRAPKQRRSTQPQGQVGLPSLQNDTDRVVPSRDKSIDRSREKPGHSDDATVGRPDDNDLVTRLKRDNCALRTKIGRLQHQAPTPRSGYSKAMLLGQTIVQTPRAGYSEAMQLGTSLVTPVGA